MLDAVTLNAVNTLLAFLLGALAVGHWRAEGRRAAVLFWALGAGALALGDFSFLIRTWLAYDAASVAAAVCVSAGLLLVLRGVSDFAGAGIRARRLAVMLAAHAVVTACLLGVGAPVALRMAVNSAVWGALSLVACRILWNAGPGSGQRFALPAGVLGVHALFQGARILVLAAAGTGVAPVGMPWIQSVSLAEASLFTVALFPALLAADLRLRNRALTAAIEEVKTLSGLLAICSGCKKIREESGHWARIESYLSEHTSARFSHGICPDCARELYPELHRTATRPPHRAVAVKAPDLRGPSR